MTIEQPTIADIRADVKALRNRTGLSQADVARLLGIPAKTFSDWLKEPPRTTCRHRQMLSLALEALSVRLR